MDHELQKKVKNLKELAQLATQGKWIMRIPDEGDFDDDSTFITTEERIEDSKIEIAQLTFTNQYEDNEDSLYPINFEQRANANYIAAANPAFILTLLAEIERLEKQSELWRRDYETLVDSCAKGKSNDQS